MLLKDKRIAVIGAGPAGLTIAKLLQQKGVNITVYERDKNDKTRIWGGTLDLHKHSGQEAMKKAGLLERYYEMSKSMGRIITDNQTKVLFCKNPKPEEIYENPEINRNNLRKLLLDSLNTETVVWDRKFTGLEIHNKKWLLKFENGITDTADFVIGANGGMSQIRKFVTDATPEYTGTYIIQGEVLNPEINCPDFFKLCDNKILMTADHGINFVANPDNNRALTYNVTFRKPKDWILKNELDFKNAAQIVTFLSNLFSDWNEIYKSLFRSTSFFAGLPTRKISLDNLWTTNRSLPITLIGDAAHLMPPFAGEGANSGLMDALILSENLINGNLGNIEDAIYDYEQKMFNYAKAAQDQTTKNEIEMHNSDFSFQKRFTS
ncbi:FAD-dependent oxidoreductase [Flavobacterium reichenbachii]|uniref:Flavin-dependent monooxygenase n=1 Tax=Flavobacterium reichenbachii TaxID=362418 RepID=A0A085ZQ90_9FLAO|nr:NAD(P)/FAD-dependent oxidoreductase [Flavobacterium reichenbachii]KFF06604.1 tetracycline resistance protein [Flavobacterium reichenbachii]